LIPDRTDPGEAAGDMKSRILAAVRAEPAPTRRATLLRNALLLAAGGAVALAIFFWFHGVRVYERPTLLVVATSSGWFFAAAVATQIAFARGRSMLGRPTAWLVALVVGAPFLLLAWKVAGYYGVDRYILPMLGTPWRPGTITGRDTRPPAEAPAG
jgi:hypothetical protein